MIYSDTKLRHFLNFITELRKIVKRYNSIIRQRHDIQVHIASAEPAGQIENACAAVFTNTVLKLEEFVGGCVVRIKYCFVFGDETLGIAFFSLKAFLAEKVPIAFFWHIYFPFCYKGICQLYHTKLQLSINCWSKDINQ